MSDALTTLGYHGVADGGGGSLDAPTISDITPIDGEATPGAPGAFSVRFKTARLTPITFHLSNIADGCEITIAMRYADRNETYVVRDAAGVFVWPFDVQSHNTFTPAPSDGEADVSLLPRGGWPPTVINLQVAAAALAVPG